MESMGMCDRSSTPESLYLGGKDIPSISGIGYHWQLQKHPLPGLSRLGNFLRLRPQNPKLPEKMGTHMRPLMHRVCVCVCVCVWGGGGD